MGTFRSRWLAGLGLALSLALSLSLALITSVHAAEPETPGSDADGMMAIPPDREAQALALLAPLLDDRSDGLELRGPSIERDRIKWWVMRDGEARCILLLVPRQSGQPDDPRSVSFAIQVAWAPEVEATAAELALVEAAIEAIQARDEGGFFVLLVDAAIPQAGDGNSLRSWPPPSPAELADSRRSWALKMSAIALLIGFAVAVTLRPRIPNDQA